MTQDPADNWKHWPQGWYAVARADALHPGQIHSGHLAGQPWVLYRGHSGTLHATDAFCPHMGAHLHNAQVCGEALVCGLHACHLLPQTAAPTLPEHIKAGCRLAVRAWPSAEHYGLIWLHPPAAAIPPLPFAGSDGGHHWLTAGPQAVAADWRAMICNGFDLEHMKAVHQRQVEGEPLFERLPENGLRMTYRTRVLPRGGLSSWLMQRLSGGTIHLVHTCVGSSIMVQSRVGRFRTSAVFALLPQDAPGTRPEQRRSVALAAIGIPHGARWPTLQLRLARALYLAFLRKDFRVVEGMRLQLNHTADVGVQAVTAYQHTLADMEHHP